MPPSRLQTWLLGSAVSAILYWCTCSIVFFLAMALGDSDVPIGPVVEGVLEVVLKVLGFPLDLMPSFPMHVFTLLGYNSLFWGPAIFVTVQFIARRRKPAA